MIHVDFDPNQLTGEQKAWWDDWQAKAQQAIEEAIQSWEADRSKPIKYKPKLWGDLKEWLLMNVFHEKCAYCETPLLRSSMHAEHYRPKGGVKNHVEGQKKPQTATSQDEAGQVINHPGYFWLAYNWRNLLPSCEYCNTAEGKRNQFPVKSTFMLLKHLQPSELAQLYEAPIESKTWPGYFYLQPADLDDLEGPQLLHPYYDYPEEHLGFGIKGLEFAMRDGQGVVSPKGIISISVYNLWDAKLRNARYEEQRNALDRFSIAFNQFIDQGLDRKDALKEAWQDAKIVEYVKGNKPYSAAVVASIRHYYPQ